MGIWSSHIASLAVLPLSAFALAAPFTLLQAPHPRPSGLGYYLIEDGAQCCLGATARLALLCLCCGNRMAVAGS